MSIPNLRAVRPSVVRVRAFEKMNGALSTVTCYIATVFRRHPVTVALWPFVRACWCCLSISAGSSESVRVHRSDEGCNRSSFEWQDFNARALLFKYGAIYCIFYVHFLGTAFRIRRAVKWAAIRVVPVHHCYIPNVDRIFFRTVSVAR